jgi:hypothetical protein
VKKFQSVKQLQSELAQLPGAGVFRCVGGGFLDGKLHPGADGVTLWVLRKGSGFRVFVGKGRLDPYIEPKNNPGLLGYYDLVGMPGSERVFQWIPAVRGASLA